MADVTVSKVDESKVFIKADYHLNREISAFFSVYADNYRWTPKFKQGIWDGKIRFYDYNNYLPIGLVAKLAEFCKKGGYSIELTYEHKNEVSKQEFVDFVDSLNIQIFDQDGNLTKPHHFQMQAAYDAITDRHVNIASSTASGKSLIIYIITCWMEAHDMKSLIVVNSVQLVEQMFGDFLSYGMEDVEQRCCRIYAGMKRMMDRKIIISTYQSLWNDEEEFLSVDALIIDEAHGAKAKSVSDLVKKCVNAGERIGVSGTFPDEGTADWFTIVGGTGRIKTYSTYKTLQDAKHIADLKIYPIRLVYPAEVREENFILNQKEYKDEVDFVNKYEPRLDFIAKLASKLEGNTLILFTKIDEHGIPILNRCKEKIKDKKLLYIDGSVSVKEREKIRHYMEREDNCILCATYGTLSTGVNIKRIHNIIFASGYKSKVKVLQSIGRGLRKYHDKEWLSLYDLVDDLIHQYQEKKDGRWYKRKYINHSVKHYKERLKLYSKEQFEIINMTYVLKLREEG